MARTASRCSRFGTERYESLDEIMKPESPNQGTAANAGRAVPFHVERPWPGIAELIRSASIRKP